PQGFGDRGAPLGVSLADHAGNQVNVDVREADFAGPVVRAIDLFGAVCAAVEFEDFGVEMLDAEAEARHADRADGFELVLLQRARLALEGNFAGGVPAPVLVDALDQFFDLCGAQV